MKDIKNDTNKNTTEDAIQPPQGDTQRLNADAQNQHTENQNTKNQTNSPTKKFNYDNHCLVCGADNPIGLKLTFHYHPETDSVICKTAFSKNFQGWENVLHGGILSTVLDEIMIKAAEQKGFHCVTAELNVKFKKPAIIGTPYTVIGKINRIRHKIIETEGKLIDQNNRTIASATGRLFKIDATVKEGVTKQLIK